MQFLLIHSPLVTKETWKALVPHLESAGFMSTVVALEKRIVRGEICFERHAFQIASALTDLEGQKTVVVAHSGAGNLLALKNPVQIAAYVFLDAIFPLCESFRFSLFDNPDAVQGIRDIAAQHDGVIPRSTLTRFGKQIADNDLRNAFIDGIMDVPINLYEESIPVHPNWPPSRPGLYVQWTDSYSADAARAEQVGFEVRYDAGSHFRMLDHPAEVARELISFAQTVG